MCHPRFAVVAIVALANAASVGAQEPTSADAAKTLQLHLPVACVVGETCWVMNYVDTDPSDAAADFTCGARTYDGHTGTDIAVRDKAAMDEGVAVLAALDGRIDRVRDGEPDRFATAEDIAAARRTGTECGNFVEIEHGDNLTTRYCHLKRGSVKVQPSQQIKAGEPMAEVGLSGWTQFPHVHFDVMRKRAKVDPFTGLNNTDGCGHARNALWHVSAKMGYQHAALYAAGFHNAQAQQKDVDNGLPSAAVLSTADPIMLFWVSVMGLRKDDMLRVTITDPDGDLFARDEHVVSTDSARQFHAIGLQLAGTDPPPGAYIGKAEVLRAGQVVQTLHKNVTVAAP